MCVFRGRQEVGHAKIESLSCSKLILKICDAGIVAPRFEYGNVSLIYVEKN